MGVPPEAPTAVNRRVEKGVQAMRIGYTLRSLQDFATTYRIAEELAVHDRWTRDELDRFQSEQLSSLVKHAVAHSPFYRNLYRDVTLDGPVQLRSLPTTTKKALMENFDQVVTDPRLKFADAANHISRISRDEHYLGKYRVLSTAGSSGQVGIFVFDRKAWATMLAALARCLSYMGLEARFRKRMRTAQVMAHSPRHVSWLTANSAAIRMYDSHILSAIEPTAKLVQALNDFQPESISMYPSIGVILAAEQLEGRLRIHPRIVETGGEVCAEGMAQTMEKAWGVKPFNGYAATEAWVIGIDCPEHRGIHVFEDLIILEVVDENNRPVADGTPGHKILVTNLYNYTQPIIRYEISDMVTMSNESCPCGRPLRLISHIEGRSDDIIELEGRRSSRVLVHPLHFHSLLSGCNQIKEYQVVHEDGDLHIHLVMRGSEDEESFAREIEDKLRTKLGSLDAECPPIRLHFTDHIERDPARMGKLKLVEEKGKR
jgi:phenylacetate-CoA ligase